MGNKPDLPQLLVFVSLGGGLRIRELNLFSLRGKYKKLCRDACNVLQMLSGAREKSDWCHTAPSLTSSPSRHTLCSLSSWYHLFLP